jgi:polar amino acid transport system substrate-binding protein
VRAFDLVPAMAKLIEFQRLCVAIVAVWALSGRASSAEPLRLVTDIYLGPSENIADDKAPGFNIEVVRQVFAAMGQDVSFEVFPSNRVRMMVLRAERDARFPATLGEQSGRCAFPDEPLARTSWVLFIRTTDIEKLKFSSFDDLVGHDVAASGSNVRGLPDEPKLSPELWSFLREHHNIVVTNGAQESLRMLAAGRVDYAVVNLNFGMRAISTMGLSGEIEPLLSRIAFDADSYVCFTKGRVSPGLVDAFSRALKQFKQTEAYRAIYAKYFP